MEQKSFFEPEERHLVSGGQLDDYCHLWENKHKNGKKLYELMVEKIDLTCHFSKAQVEPLLDSDYFSDVPKELRDIQDFQDITLITLSISHKGLNIPVVFVQAEILPDFMVSTLSNLEELK